MAKRALTKKKKRIIAVAVVIVIAAALLVTGLCLTSSQSAGTVYVQSVSAVSGNSAAGGVSNVYSGVAENAKTVTVERDSSLTVKEVYVSAGTKVKKGETLFSYDTSQNEIDLKQARLELEKLKTELSSYNTQIAQYEKQRKAAETEAEELEYTTQILNMQTSVKETQYNIESKELEISNLEKTAAEASVKAPIAGTVKSVNSSSDDEYITIIATGNLSVRGVINEQNVDEITVGEKVLVRSRVDESVVWRGTINSIGDEPVEDSTSVSKSSQYNFFITLSADDGLKLGQHVYIEADYGQTESGAVSLPEYYIVDADSSPYVWAVDSQGVIAKREIILGDYNENTRCYEVKSGLAASDYIAWPSQRVKEGQTAVISDDGSGEETTADSE